MYKAAFVAVVFVIAFWALVFSLMPTHRTVVYDCRLSEISPDYPIQVKEACRKLRLEHGRF